MTACARRFTKLLLLCLLLVTAAGQAAISHDRSKQRAEFLQAEKALKSGDEKAYQQAKQSLRDYPLYPYLEYQELRPQLSRVNSDQARRFLRDHQDTPLGVRFRRNWLDELARRGRWQAYVEFYRPTSNPRLRCHYAHALIETGGGEQGWQAAESLWLSGRSRPDACDPVFDAWRAAGKLHSNLVWQRVALAMEARQTRLTRYLGRFLPAQEKAWLQRWLEVHRKPQKILDHDEFTEAHPYRQQILLHGLKRLVRRDADAGLAAWRQLERKYPFGKAERYQAERALALAFIDQEHPDTMQRLEALVPEQEDDRLLEARLRTALSQQDWPRMLAWLDALPETLAGSERWRYWRARSLQNLGQEQQATAIYQSLAAKRSYHGFLSADRVAGDYNLDHTPLSVADPLLARIASIAGLQRARELFHLGRLQDARREWRAATVDLDTPELKAAAKLAQNWGWHEQAIFTLARTRYWEDLELRFPVAHQTHVDQAADKRKLDNAWVFAVVRQESAFAVDARSRAGAMGLMQLMPGTARDTARQLQRRPPRRSELLTPEINIELGTAYLRLVLEKLNDNPVLATAAYNAGPHRVSNWLPAESAPADLWIETIPFKETRRYTQRVLAYSVIYDQRLGKQPTRLNQRMPPVTPDADAASVAAADTADDARPL